MPEAVKVFTVELRNTERSLEELRIQVAKLLNYLLMDDEFYTFKTEELPEGSIYLPSVRAGSPGILEDSGIGE